MSMKKNIIVKNGMTKNNWFIHKNIIIYFLIIIYLNHLIRNIKYTTEINDYKSLYNDIDIKSKTIENFNL